MYALGDFINLNGSHGSVTLIGAVSPTGGDFSEPVTENTRRSVNVFLGLDKNLAYSRHYPAINWLNSYSNYLNQMANYYENISGEDIVSLRNKMMEILTEEDKLQSIVMLVGKDSLSDKQKNLLDVASMIKIAFLQQNAFNDTDKYVPLNKQIQMLKVIENYYNISKNLIEEGISYKNIYDKTLIAKINSMKYDIKNDEIEKFASLNNNIQSYFQSVKEGNK